MELQPRYWSFSLSISLSNEYSRLISSRIDWFDLLAVKGLSSLLSPLLIGIVKILFSVWNFHVYIFFLPKISTFKNGNFICINSFYQRKMKAPFFELFLGLLVLRHL